MKREKTLPGAMAFLGMLILILDGKTALLGARDGLELCLKAVIPALFPYFILSILLTNTLSGARIPLLAPIGKILGIPRGCESILIPAFLGGYPAGAQAVSQLYRSRYLDRQNAERLLSFLNNAGPAFLFGIVGPMFPRMHMVWALWAIHICGALAAAVITKPREVKTGSSLPGAHICMADAVKGAIQVMASVCAWILLFRMVMTFLQRWFLWLLPVPCQTAIAGLLELSNGCLALPHIADLRLRFLLCSILLSFGGVCVTMQTKSVTSGLSLKYYLTGKLLQTAFCLVFCLGVLYGKWLPALVLTGISLTKRQKNGSFPQKVGV